MVSIFAKISVSIYKAVKDTIQHDGVEHAGYMAFLSIVSLFPFLVFMMALAGFVGGLEAGHKFVELLLSNLPPHIVPVLAGRINEINTGPPQELMTIAIIGAIWTASASVEGMRTALNKAYRVTTPPPYIWRRLMSVGQFLIISSVLLLIMFMMVVLPPLLKKFVFLQEIWPSIAIQTYNLQRVFLLLALMFAIALLYVTIPNMKMKLRRVIPASLIVASLWMLLGKMLSLYFQSFEQINLIYGSIKSIIFSLFFFYLLHLVFIFGAEFTYHWQKQHKSTK